MSIEERFEGNFEKCATSAQCTNHEVNGQTGIEDQPLRHVNFNIDEDESSVVTKGFRLMEPAGAAGKYGGGIAYRQLTVSGLHSTRDYQRTFSNYPGAIFRACFASDRNSKRVILDDFEGLVKSREMVLVLGKPGSGCTTLLKTLAGLTHGLSLDTRSMLNFQGFSWNTMREDFRGECTYQAESDTHFPHLTVSQTMTVAAEARTGNAVWPHLNRESWARQKRDATLALLGLSEAAHTKVGNDLVPGISGGERQRLSIAEVLVGGSIVQCWDNSTRGLDSSNARNFLTAVRSSLEANGSVALVTLYQASQDMYDAFDIVMLLYEGRQIYFGKTSAAKTYFTNLGFVCPRGVTTSNFLTSLTDPRERKVREGFVSEVPCTAEDFARIWKQSLERAELLEGIKSYERQNPIESVRLPTHGAIPFLGYIFGQSKRNPFMLSFRAQISLCARRGFQRLVNDLAPPVSSIFGNAIVSVILGSIFFNMPEETSTFYGRGVLIFFTVLTNTFLGAFEGVQLWNQRPVVEKHHRFAFYHPAAEAVASMICDLPNKLFLTAFFNVPVYFLANMRRTPAAFFTFYLFAFSSLLTGSMLFRTIGAMSRTLTSSIAPGADFILLLVIYTGFVLPIPSMHPWLRWFNYIDPVGYAFESLMINEFAGREFACSQLIPQGADYAQIGSGEQACAAIGANTDSKFVQGSDYLAISFQYYPMHLWRNLGIMVAFMIFLCGLYLIATELVSTQHSKGDILIFQRKHEVQFTSDIEAQCQNPSSIARTPTYRQSGESTKAYIQEKQHGATFLWENLCYTVRAKSGSRKLLEGIDGWIQPGTLTALMGASGAGKTTLLNILAKRAATGTVSGDVYINSTDQHSDAPRKVGYAQQQDLHNPSSTVREALLFSACLRQSKYSRAENLAYVEEVIQSLDMVRFSDAVIGVPGAGLNVEQRKRVTIGIELAARPELLLFLDEPTSGLDSTTAWSICALLRKLADNGQSILCTIHQPSRPLFEMFDQLLLLKNGKTAYFGGIGADSGTLMNYFEKHGAPKCAQEENPAEWLLNVTNGSLGSRMDWPAVWLTSEERKNSTCEIERMKGNMLKPVESQKSSSQEYATSFAYQLYVVTRRNFENDWRTPSYLYSKVLLTLGAGIVNGFSFYLSTNSLQGVQNQIFSTFLLFTLHSNLVQLILPRFLENRDLYESHERPSRTYSWQVFVLSNIVAELPWQTLLGVIQFVTWYYPLGMYRNALSTHELHQRGGLMFLTIWSFMLFSSTFSQMLATVMPDAATGVNISALLYSLSLIFCGVLVNPSALPRFWIFMYRTTPVTYFVNAILSTGIAGTDITCEANEIVRLNPPSGTSCGVYLENYLSYAGGRLLNPSAMEDCQFCPVATTDDLLATLGIFFADRWKSFGISLVYSAVNVGLALGLYWLFRVPKGASQRNSR